VRQPEPAAGQERGGGMKLQYNGYDVAGKPVADVIEARSAAEASDQLRRDGVFVLEIKEDDSGAVGHGARRAKRVGQGNRLKNLAIFTRQLQVLLATGTPLMQSLGALERQSTDAGWRQVIQQVRAAVEDGTSLAAAMGQHPEYFDAICRSLVAAGESAGNLPGMLERLAVLTRKQLHVRRSIIGATIYPALLVVVAMGVLIMLLTFVLPRFEDLFKSLDTPLPPTTKVLMGVSGILRSYWWAVIAGSISGGFLGWAWVKSEAGRRTFQTLVLHIPQFGPIVKNFATARIARLLGILLQGRVPLVDSLQLTEGACGNHKYAKLVAGARDAVTRGESLAMAFADTRLIAPSVQEAILSGERSGQLGPLLTTLADFLEEQNEVTIKSLTSILEPLILMALGVLVGVIAISMFLPLFDLTAATRG
jgi:type IV pilus assembly protein PilC